MATSKQASNEWSVLVYSKCKGRNRMFTMVPTTTVAEVQQEWQASTAFSGDVEFRSESGEVLFGQQTMEEVGEAIPGSKMVKIFVVEALSVRLQVFKGDSVTQINLRLTQSPEELFPSIRESLPILGDRPFRLRTVWDPLEDERSLADQDVDEQTPLFVDPSIDVDVIDQWEGDTQELTVFSSEMVAVLAADDVDRVCEHRFVLGERKTLLHLWDDFVDAVGVVAPTSEPLCVLDIRLRHVTLCVGGRFMQRVVWPDTTVSKVLPASWSLAWPVIFNGKRLSPADTMLKVGVSEDAIITDAVRVHVRLSCGNFSVVEVPSLGVVSDVAEAVRKEEPAGRWRLRCAGRLLDSDELIPSSAIAGKEMVVDRASWTFTVALSDRSVRWRTDRHEMVFSVFASELARHSDVEYAALVKRTYQCRGCRRRVMIEEEGFQLLPAPCCRTRSLSLTEVAGKAEAVTQAASSLRSTSPTPADVPSAPKDLHAQVQESLTETLTWIMPDCDGGERITDYVIEKKEEGDHTWSPVTTVSASKMTCLVDRLPQDSRFEFRVAALNFLGKGPSCETPDAVQIKKPVPPKFKLATNFKTEIKMKKGTSDTVELPFEASPQPTSMWTWNEEEDLPQRVQTSVLSNVARLHFETVDVGDAGHYQLKLENHHGQDTVNVILTVINVPSAPKDLQAQVHKKKEARLAFPLSKNLEVVLNWIQPENDGGERITDYVIEKKEEDGIWEPVTTVPALQTSCVVESLREGRHFFFRVAGVNEVGKGPSCETPDAVQIKEPEIRWFRLWNDRTDAGAHRSHQSFSVPDRGSVRELREAVARWLGVSSRTVVLICRFLRLDGVEMMHVWDVERGANFFVGEGKERPASEVESIPRYWRELQDAEPIPAAPGRSPLLRASSSSLREFAGTNEIDDFNDGNNFLESFPLRERGLAGELKAAIGRRMELPAADIVLSRAVAEDSGVEVYGVRDNNDRSNYFCDLLGQRKVKKDHVNWRWETLKDAEEFPFIPDWRNWIRVSRRP